MAGMRQLLVTVLHYREDTPQSVALPVSVCFFRGPTLPAHVVTAPLPAHCHDVLLRGAVGPQGTLPSTRSG